ncbi:DUF1146 family protein [Sporolactobacillus laevolacticus]|uniref:Membrane protein n=1 Tax=Sporolactobacillus laevolacticus DSM 442 TaxID=1395513 RepID=V6IZV0_9BACL|nr:DUF1146 family protein [Sporolactobacillus laevolacticus]EST12386.1 membrane protein [Sporolactobacillus laevolacticus DSM 442]MDN3955276.1 DUF1146 family protein [Sporolactobacillus laevolacticus]
MISNSGLQAMISILFHLFFLALTWWALQSLKLDAAIRNPKSLQARILYVLLAIAISYPVAKFFLDYVIWSLMLPQIYN